MRIEPGSVYDLFSASNAKKIDNPVFARDAFDALKDKEINVAATVSFSKEGIEELRKQVKEMPGYFDWGEEMEFRALSFKIDPAGEQFFAMADTRQSLLNEIKKNKSEYNLEDLMPTVMEAYARQLDSVYKERINGDRDFYLSDGMENGKIKYHQVTMEEDLGFVDKAFERTSNGLAILAGIQEQRWQIDHQFAGKPKLSVALPKNYEEKITDILSNAGKEFKDNYLSGKYSDTEAAVQDAISIGNKYLNEDSDFVYKMRELFKGLKAMPQRG